MVIQIEHVELVVDIIRLIFENPSIMGMCMSLQCWEVLYVAGIVGQWIEKIKRQHPFLFRVLTLVAELLFYYMF